MTGDCFIHISGYIGELLCYIHAAAACKLIIIRIKTVNRFECLEIQDKGKVVGITVIMCEPIK